MVKRVSDCEKCDQMKAALRAVHDYVSLEPLELKTLAEIQRELRALIAVCEAHG